MPLSIATVIFVLAFVLFNFFWYTAYTVLFLLGCDFALLGLIYMSDDGDYRGDSGGDSSSNNHS